ncbi:MAG: alpha-L-arabinofuranosidase C-terminal domain-containing protein [Steroidobacteraceae bacterium]|jgi:alpha-N-arabinofuranosidase
MKLYEFVVGALILISFSASAVAAAVSVSVTVTVDTTKPGPQIDRNIYGQFAEHLGRGIYEGIWVGENSNIPNIKGYRKDVVDALKRIHVPVVRWPGGCFADQYDWRDGIGPRATRPVRINVNWGGVTDDNAFGTHEFLDFAELLGADAYVVGNMGSMSPRDMAQWLEYMTSAQDSSLAQERRKNGRDQPWQVKYFGIGNEAWGCGGMMRADYAADVTRRYSSFLNARAEQNLVKVATGPSANEPATADYAETMMKNGLGLFGRPGFQALSLHYYTFPIPRRAASGNRATGFGEDEWSNILRSARQMDDAISTVSGIMDKYDPDKKVALFVDEWGAWHDAEPGTNPRFLYQQNSLLDAEVAALTLNIFHRHTDRVRMANIAQMINVIQAMILTNKEKMLLTPTYHVFDMYQPFQGAMPYPVITSGPSYDFNGSGLPTVDASAARSKDGKLILALVNLDPNRSVLVTTNLTGRAHGQILTGPAMDTHNTFEAPETIHPSSFIGANGDNGKLEFKLPAKSVAVITVE